MTPEFITEWLQQPHTDISTEELSTLLKTHSYFVPLRYMNAALQHRDNYFNGAMMDAVLPYKGNWQQFYNLLSASSNKKNDAEKLEIASDNGSKSNENKLKTTEVDQVSEKLPISNPEFAIESLQKKSVKETEKPLELVKESASIPEKNAGRRTCRIDS